MRRKIKSIDIPQTNRLESIRRLVGALSEGTTGTAALCELTGIPLREVSYAIHSARVLGLLSSGDRPTVSRSGSRLLYTKEGSIEEKEVFANAMANSKILSSIAPELLSSILPTRAELAASISKNSDLSDSTAKRRAGTLLSWRQQLGDGITAAAGEKAAGEKAAGEKKVSRGLQLPLIKDISPKQQTTDLKQGATRVLLPSRYEDLDDAFKGRLRPNLELIELVKSSFTSMQISGGIRFLPVYGESGSGKSCAARELDAHLPDCRVFELPRQAIESGDELTKLLEQQERDAPQCHLLIGVVDQYEEAVAERQAIPTQFVERLSLLDRAQKRRIPILFIWLTTSPDFRQSLVKATNRNRRILVSNSFQLYGPSADIWPEIIEETFQFHNGGQELADFQILQEDLIKASKDLETIGRAIEHVGSQLSPQVQGLHDLSKYQVIMLWPVTDGVRIQRIIGFTNAREGYKLDWNAWARELNKEDRDQLPLRELNKARLYFDMRLVPIAAADLHSLCMELDNDKFVLHKTYLDRFEQTHFVSILSGKWNPENYSMLKERDSSRAENARVWYKTANREPTKIGRRIAKVLRELHYEAKHEQTVKSPFATIRADVLVEKAEGHKSRIIVELKALSPENTNPSKIKDSVRTTLKRHAQLAGFLSRQ